MYPVLTATLVTCAGSHRGEPMFISIYYLCIHNHEDDTQQYCAITLPSRAITASYLCSSYVYVFLHPYHADYILSDKVTLTHGNRLLRIYYSNLTFDWNVLLFSVIYLLYFALKLRRMISYVSKSYSFYSKVYSVILLSSYFNNRLFNLFMMYAVFVIS